MTTKEAHELTLRFVSDLEKDGFKVLIKPYGKAEQDTIDKYSGPERIPHKKWSSVNFEGISREGREVLHEKVLELSRMGIQFDTGGTVGSQDWRLDWSFKYTGMPDGGHAEALGMLNDLQTDMEDGIAN